MTVQRTLALVASVACVFLLPIGTRAAQQKLVVTCADARCEFHRVAEFFVGGRSAVRVLAVGADKAADRLKGSREVNIDQMAGFFREPKSGMFYALGLDGLPLGVVVLPPKGEITDAASLTSAWSREALTYGETLNAKVRTTVPPESFAFLFVSPDPDATALRVLQQLLASDSDPRRAALIEAVLQFTAKSRVAKEALDALLARIREDVKGFSEQSADPTRLAAASNDAAGLGTIYRKATDGKENTDVLDRIASDNDSLTRRLAVSQALYQTKFFWDEYLVKIRQLGLAKWSIPNIFQQSQEALNQSALRHQQQSREFVKQNSWESAFDEAELAARSSCQSSAIGEFRDARVDLVNHNVIASSQEYTGPNRARLDQIVRDLRTTLDKEQVDASTEQLMLERIATGEQLEANFLPLALKHAELLAKLGKYTDAIAVVQRIERNVRLDHAQLDDFLKVDGAVTNNLLTAVKTAQDETRVQFDRQSYQTALDAAAKGLKADPSNASLLYYSAMSAAFLRQGAAAAGFIRSYLRDANLACTSDDAAKKMLELYALVTLPPVPPGTEGIPHWISGVRYASKVFYDPISLGFLQPVSRIATKDGTTTVFIRDARSFLVSSIFTDRAYSTSANVRGPATRLFDAEPQYDRQTLAMQKIGPPGTSVPGARSAAYSLTYLKGAGIAPDLVFRFTGKQIARGWAGNPFFHPFIWNGFFVFDLTYDPLGRVTLATPVQEDGGARADQFSDVLEFKWDGDSNRLLSIHGKKNGYLRQMAYAADGRLTSEKISYQAGRGTIDYEFLPGTGLLKGARAIDDFYEKSERLVTFDPNSGLR